MKRYDFHRSFSRIFLEEKMKNVQVRLENTKPGHFKFWSAVLKSRTVRCFWGRIGSCTQSKKFSFESNADALDFLQRKIESKLGRGYELAN